MNNCFRANWKARVAKRGTQTKERHSPERRLF